MAARARIFISTVSKELRSARQLVANTLSFLGYEPVWQDIFGTESGDVGEMLRRRIDECQGVVHLVGRCYGFEPPAPDPEFGRCSYTQLEYLYAVKRKKKVWVLFMDERFPVDPHNPESAEHQQLQASYRAVLCAGAHLYHPLDSTAGLEASILKLRNEFTALRQTARRWAAAVVALLLAVAGGVILLLRGQGETATAVDQVAEAVTGVSTDIAKQTDTLAQVLADIEKVGQASGLITDPDTYAEYYHNARILQQRGEVDMAMLAYERAIAEGYLFVDPLLYLLDLANARYGADGALTYFEKRINGKIPRELVQIGDIALGGNLLTLVQPILNGEVNFSPLLAMWSSASYKNWNEMDTLTVGKARNKAAELISKDYKSGKLQGFYIDKIRGATVGESATQTFDSMMQSGQQMVDSNSISRTSTYFVRVGPGEARPYMKGFDIRDRVDLNQPITFCASAQGADQPT